MKITVFKKVGCKVCEKFEEGIRNTLKKSPQDIAVDVETVYTDEAEGLVKFAEADFGRIPAALFLSDNGEELMRWDGKADWDGLRQVIGIS